MSFESVMWFSIFCWCFIHVLVSRYAFSVSILENTKDILGCGQIYLTIHQTSYQKAWDFNYFINQYLF